MFYRLQMEIFQYLASPQFSTGFCVTHKLATFATSQYSQCFKRKVEVTMKFETNLSQEPLSTRKKETFVQSYILLYSIFLKKKLGIIVAVWQNLWFPHKIATILFKIFICHTSFQKHI